MMANAGVEQPQASVSPVAHLGQWQASKNTLCAIQRLIEQSPALGAMATGGNVPARWLLYLLGPISRLKSDVCFANVVKEAENAQPRDVDRQQCSTSSPFSRAAHSLDMHQRMKDACHVDHVI
jgi:hypothetical protein